MNIASSTRVPGKTLLKSTAKTQSTAETSFSDSVDLNPVRTGLFRKMDSLDALAKTRTMGQGLLSGSLHTADLQSVESPSRVLQAAGDAATGSAKPIFNTVNDWSANGDGLLPINRFESMLTQSFGMKETGRGSVSANYENNFEMRYASDGGFLGSGSKRTDRPTKLGSIRVLQSPGAPVNGPAAIVVNYTRPGFVGPSLEGTNHDKSSGFHSIYFVPDASKVTGATGETTGDDAATKERMEALLKSVSKEADVELHSYTQGYGRVGTSHSSRVNIGDEVVKPGAHFQHAVAAACDHAIGTTLGIKLPEETHSTQPSVSGRERLAGATQGALLAALGAGVGAGAAALFGGEAGVGLLVAGSAFTVISGVASKDPNDGYYGNKPGSYEAFKKRESKRFWTGIGVGAGITATLAAGSFLGVPGVLGVAAVGAVAGGALARGS